MWTLLAVFVLLLIAGGAFCWFYLGNEYQITMQMEGPEELTLEYGQTYEEPGASATVQGTRIHRDVKDLEVTTEGQVDTEKVGIYRVVYRARMENLTVQKTRLIRVVDTKAPEIQLVTKTGSFTFPNTAYEEEGFTATDEYDGDLTDQVVRTEKDGQVIYTVEDSSGNRAEVTRTIVYDDPIPPELHLEGKEKMSIPIGGTYQEPGFTASDNCDGDLTEQVVVEGSVDTKTAGTYELIYTVTDSYENTVSVKRTVMVYEPEPETEALPKNPVGGVVYLTFDDGPGRHTERLLDVLNKHGVKATFFMVDTGYIHLAQRIAQEGHTVACHTETHRYSQVYASDEAYFQDLYAIQSAIEQQTGEKSMLLRFPGGSSNTVSRAYCKGIMSRITKAVEEQGFHYFDWNVDSFDAGGARSADEVFHNVVNGISRHSTSVVLQHDIHGFSVDAVERIIQWGQANGYTFLPLTADSPGCHHGINN